MKNLHLQNHWHPYTFHHRKSLCVHHWKFLFVVPFNLMPSLILFSHFFATLLSFLNPIHLYVHKKNIQKDWEWCYHKVVLAEWQWYQGLLRKLQKLAVLHVGCQCVSSVTEALAIEATRTERRETRVLEWNDHYHPCMWIGNNLSLVCVSVCLLRV